MPLFTYKAVDQDGRTILGRIDALNIVNLEMRLRHMELDLIKGELISNRNLFGASGVPPEIIHFCFHLEQQRELAYQSWKVCLICATALNIRVFVRSSPASSSQSKVARPCRRPWTDRQRSSTRCLSA